MGVSWNHEVHFVCSDDETDYVKSLKERLPGLTTEVPVHDLKQDENVVSFTSGGYNIFDLFNSNFPRPKSWVGVVHRISPRQGQEFDVVDILSREEIEEKIKDYDAEDLEFSNPLVEYIDPSSDYWTDCNPHLNIYHEEPTFSDLMSDYDGDDDKESEEYDKRYQTWLDKQNSLQEMDIKGGIREFKQCALSGC